MRRLSGKLVSFIIVGVAVSLVGIVTAADAVTSPPTADMAVTSMRASVTSATHGSVITFTEVIRNNGPETVEMDAQPQISGGVLVTETCDLGISPDTPFCEYGFIDPGISLTTRYRVRVTATHGAVVVKGGVSTEEPELDDNPFNQFRATSVRVG